MMKPLLLVYFIVSIFYGIIHFRFALRLFDYNNSDGDRTAKTTTSIKSTKTSATTTITNVETSQEQYVDVDDDNTPDDDKDEYFNNDPYPSISFIDEKKSSQQQNAQNQQDRQRKSSLLVIAVAPRTIKHVVALWTELECFTLDVDHVILSGPTWSMAILQQIIDMATSSIPRFSINNNNNNKGQLSPEVSIEVQTYSNNRYDVGLWCDALETLEQSNQLSTKYDQVALLNDSVFALRPYTSILDSLDTYQVNMTSLNYSYRRPQGNGNQYYWLESVWRGLDTYGLEVFMDYSCYRPVSDPLFCSHRWFGRQKGCIVQNFERLLVDQFTYPKEQTMGLYPSDVPSNMISRKHKFPTWVRNSIYWNKLVKEDGFPVSKVNWDSMIDSIYDNKLHTCTQYLNWTAIGYESQNFDFTVAKKAI